MFTNQSLRTGTGLIAATCILLLLSLSLAGCSEDSAPPTAVDTASAPVLPKADNLQFDFSFFDAAQKMDKTAGEYDNFVNAYLRTVVLGAVAHLVLAAPVGTFEAALNTVPVAQDDGSWIWGYDWQYGPDPIHVSLRGLPNGDVVEWEMSLSPIGSDYSVVWFDGTTNGDGEEGHWTLYDLDTEGTPVSGSISWGRTENGDFLEFTGLDDDGLNDTLRFADNDPDFQITYTPGDGSDLSFIRWHADGTGSLMVPDYNEGLEACWDVYQRNVDCN